MATTTTDYARARRNTTFKVRASRHPGNTTHRNRGNVLAKAGSAGVVGVALLLAQASHAAEWRFVPSVIVTETYTDNLRLAPRGSEQSDFVTQITPGFTVTNNGPRLQVRASYGLQSTLYANSDAATNFSSMLDGTVNATLIKDLFLLDARASVGQQNISAFGPQASSNINVTGNRTDVRTYSISPYLVHRFDNFADSRLRYTHESLGANSALLSNSSTDRVQLDVNSGSAFRNVSWGIHGYTEKARYTNSDSVDRSTLSANGAYRILPTFQLTATGGYEKFTYQAPTEQPSGAFYTAGFIWTPTSRTNVTASAGHRFFGPTYALAASHRARNAVISVNYNEDITTSQEQFLTGAVIDTAGQLNTLYSSRIPDPLLRQQLVNALISQSGLPSSLANPVNGFTNRYFLQKSLQASVAVTGARSTVVGTVFSTRREAAQAQLSPVPGLDDNTRQAGVTGSWNLRLSPRTNALANVNYTHTTSLTSDRTDTNKLARFALTTAFQPKLNGSLEYRRTVQDIDAVGGEIRENAIIASLLMQF